MHQQIRPGKAIASVLKNAGDADDIVTPLAGAALGQAIQVEFEMLGKLLGMNQQFSIGPFRDGYAGGKVDGGGHHEAVVIVSVFADKIDAARRAEDPWALLEQFFEELNELA